VDDLLDKEVVQIFAHGEERSCVPNSRRYIRRLWSRNDYIELKWVRLRKDGGSDIACIGQMDIGWSIYKKFPPTSIHDSTNLTTYAVRQM